MNPFDIVHSVSNGREKTITTENEKNYNAFIVNRALSYHADSLFHANGMNMNHHLDGLLQYDYLFHSLRKKKRFSKWFKKEKTIQLDAVMEHYHCSYRKALEIIRTLSDNDLQQIVAIVTAGRD